MSAALQLSDAQRLDVWVSKEETRSRILAAVGSVMDGEQFVALMYAALTDPKYAGCTTVSKAEAFMKCATLGLLPSADQVALIPRKDALSVMVQWQGLKALMERNPAVLEVQAYLVHKNDQFTVANGVPVHEYDPLDGGRVFKGVQDARGGYVKIIYRDGRPPRYHFVSAAHIDKSRKCAQTQNVWSEWTEQMMLKTLYRDAYARRAVPIDPLVSSQLHGCLSAEDADFGNDPRGSGEEEKPERLKEKLQKRKRSKPEPAPEPVPQSIGEVLGDPQEPDPVEMALMDYRQAIPQAASVKDAESFIDHAMKDPALAGREDAMNLIRTLVALRKAELAKD